MELERLAEVLSQIERNDWGDITEDEWSYCENQALASKFDLNGKPTPGLTTKGKQALKKLRSQSSELRVFAPVVRTAKLGSFAELTANPLLASGSLPLLSQPKNLDSCMPDESLLG